VQPVAGAGEYGLSFQVVGSLQFLECGQELQSLSQPIGGQQQLSGGHFGELSIGTFFSQMQLQPLGQHCR
jgi:hypothetical protein